mgnify:CR=1 FL=1
MLNHVKKNTKENKWSKFTRAWVRDYRFCRWLPTQFTPQAKTQNRREKFVDGNKFDIAHCSDRECARRVRQMAARSA